MNAMMALDDADKQGVELGIDVAMYNVGFGDCILVTFTDPDDPWPRRILFDCGRHAGSRPWRRGDVKFDDALARLVADVTDPGRPPQIDVVVATHRHRDHVHGFSKTEVWKQVKVREVWLPWVEDPRNRLARQIAANQSALANRTIHALRALRAAAGDDATKRQTDEAIEIAYNATSNAEAMATLTGNDGRGGFLEPLERIRYLPREGYEPDVLIGDHRESVLPEGVRVHVLGPSRDPRTIKRLDPPSGESYRALMPANTELGADEVDADGVGTGRVPEPFGAGWQVADPSRFGFTRAELKRVEEMLGSATMEPLELVYQLDGAVNGTSLVLLIEVGATKLLFPGDAQWGTWESMLTNPATKALLKGTALYKVGHHGSHNATPRSFVEECLSPGVTEAALIPVAPTKYGGGWQHIPVDDLVTDLHHHAKSVVITGVTPISKKSPPVKPKVVYVTSLRGTVKR